MKELILKTGKYFIYLIFLTVTFSSCDKVQDSQIPNVPFTFTIDLNILNQLRVPGNSMYFPDIGYGGVIVYCELENSYYAYDATCPYEINHQCKIKNEGVLGKCSCCGSQFVLIGGAYPTSGPAAAPLKQYHVAIVNSFTLRIYN